MFCSVLLTLAVFLVGSNAQDCSPPKMSPLDCCPGFIPSAVTPAVLTECGLPKDITPGTQPPCDISICIMKKINALTPDNKVLDKATFVTAMDNQYTSDLKPLLGPAYDACIDQETKGSCGPYSFIMCVKTYMLKNCPASVANSSPDCAATKTFFEKCIQKA